MSTEQEQKVMDKKKEEIMEMLINKLYTLPTTDGRSIVERRPPKEAHFTKFRREPNFFPLKTVKIIDYSNKAYLDKLRATKISTLLEKDAKEDLRELLRNFEKTYYPK